MSTNVVYDFLKTHNRPYSANDIVSNLKDVSKSVVQKSLDKLVERNKIFEKTYGKQKIYCVVQEFTEEPDELRRIQTESDRHLTEVVGKKLELERELRSKEAELTALKSSLSIEDAKIEKNRLLNSIQDMENKLKSIIEENGSKDLSEMKKNALKQIEIYTREYSKRKRLCGEMIDAILEGFPGTKKDLYEEIGIENVEI